MSPKMIAILSGLFLVITGVILIAIQFYFQVSEPDVVFPQRGLHLEAAGASANVSTTYVGLALVIAGSFLEVIGFVVGRKNDSENTSQVHVHRMSRGYAPGQSLTQSVSGEGSR